MELLLSLIFLSWWRVFKRRSNRLKTVWIPLEAGGLNGWITLSNDPCKYEFHSILDDSITYNEWWDHLFLVLQLCWMFWFKIFCGNHSFGQKLGELVEPQIPAKGERGILEREKKKRIEEQDVVRGRESDGRVMNEDRARNLEEKSL